MDKNHQYVPIDRTLYSILHSGGLFLAAFIGVCIVIAVAFNATAEHQATALSEARSTATATLHENGIPAFTGDYHLELITFDNVLHPQDPTFYSLEILGVETSNSATVYHLFDSDGYTSTLSIASNGMPTWRPDCQPDSTEYDINPKYISASHDCLEGNFSVRFVTNESEPSDNSAPSQP